MKTNSGSPVPNRDTTGRAGRASGDKRGQKVKGEESSAGGGGAQGASVKSPKALAKPGARCNSGDMQNCRRLASPRLQLVIRGSAGPNAGRWWAGEGVQWIKHLPPKY